MIKGDYRDLLKMTRENECPEHGYCLNLVWNAQENSYAIRCGGGHFPDTLTRQLSLTQLYKTGEPLPSYIEENIKRRENKKAMVNPRQQGKPELSLIPHIDLGTGELMVPDLIESLVRYASKYGLD
ncbi:hypothetical protein LCGC14_2188890, partial [marine sediment metagenome]